MSNHSPQWEKQYGSESGHAVVTFMIVLIVGALGFLAGRMVPNSSLPEAIQKIGPATLASSQGSESKPVSESNPLLARVNGAEITSADIQEALQHMPDNFKQFPEDVVKQIALDQMIGERVIDAKIGGENLANDPEVTKQIASATKQIVRSVFIEREVKKAITDERIQKAYDDYKANFPKVDEVKAAHILVSADDEQKAKDLIKMLDGGADFSKLAKENSLDGSSETGGDLGYFAKEEVVPEFAKAAFETAVGSYTKAPVKSSFGYHIIKVEDKRQRPAAEFETAKPYLEQEISRQMYNELISQWREAAKVEIFDEKGNPVADVPPQAEAEEGLEPDAGEHLDVEPATGGEATDDQKAEEPKAAEGLDESKASTEGAPGEAKP